MGPDSSIMAPLEMTGRVFTFSWQKDESEYRARLDLEVSVIHSSERKLILRKHFKLSSSSYHENSPDHFAKAMASVMARFSKELQEDLCRKATGSAEGRT